MEKSVMDESYEMLVGLLEELSNHVIGIYEETIVALKTLNAESALKIIKHDQEIDNLQEGVVEEATIMIIRRQPVASDLRKILMAMRLSYEYERVADYTKNIAEYIILIKEKDSLDHYEKNVDKFVAMMEVVKQMLEYVFEGLKNEDKGKIKMAGEMDTQIDELHEEVMTSLITHIRETDGKVFGTAYAILINKYIERAGDHITNIVEETLFALQGRKYKF